MFTYLASPIDQSGSSSWLADLRIAVQSSLRLAGIGVYRPHLAYQAATNKPDHAQFIDELNNAAIWRADSLIAILPAGVPTLGTPVEIESALALGKPVVVFTDIVGSVQVAAWSDRGATVIDLNINGVPGSDELTTLLTPLQVGPFAGPNTMLVKYDKGALPLTKAHPGDAGFDVATLTDVVLHYGERTLIPTGVRAMVPEGWYGRLTGRSSAGVRWHVEVHEGVIDAGYTGELKIAVTYKGPGGSVEVPAGTRLGQYVLGPVWDGELAIVEEMPATLRGEKGWGSSGV